MNRTACRMMLVLLSPIVSGGASGGDPDPLPYTDGSATVVLLPDTQWYTRGRAHFFEAQARWIAENRERRRIACAIHLGDITQGNLAAEWEIARAALGPLEGLVPLVLVPGNHDYVDTGRSTLLNEYFPLERMRRCSAFGGVYEEGHLENSYHLLSIGGRPWIVLGLELGPRDEVVRWADGILSRHYDRLAIVATHAYLFRDGTRYDHTRARQRASPDAWGNDGEELWQKLIRRHRNVSLVVCGHVRTGGLAYLASAGDHGNEVHQILTDYEALRGGGSAYFRLLEFLPDGKTLQVKAYSPDLDRYLTDPRNQFTFALGVPEGETAERLDGGRWKRITVHTASGLPLDRDGAIDLGRYRGVVTKDRLRATGFFRTERTGGRWTLVDPEGHPFLSIGLCSVNLSEFRRGAEVEKFGDRAKWAEETSSLLEKCGFNTLGRWSDAETLRGVSAPLAYTTTLSFMKAYSRERLALGGERPDPGSTIPVFDDAFPDFCDAYARRLEATRDDPWLLGHFSDNELPFRPDALDRYLGLPPSDPGHRAAREWLATRKKGIGEVTERDRIDFLAVVAGRYFSTVKRAILKSDPNHLYLGSRLNGRNINEGSLRGSGAVDVVSINLYHRWSIDGEEMNRWAELSGRPILNSEWYAMRVASPDAGAAGAGFRVRSQRDRGLFYQNLCLGMLRNPNCVGWHWFKYGGDGPGHSRGFVDAAFAPHEEMLEEMREINTRAYRLRNLFFP